jgi:NDP-sugar pyrophosphorylase family protein
VHGLILAGGEGTRLRADGVAVPKPLATVGDEPLIARLLRTLAGLGCETLTCMVRAEFPTVFQYLDGRSFGPPVLVRECRTPSSLHTLVAGLAAIAPGPVFATMVDTVMPPDDWRAVYQAAAQGLEGGLDVMLAVTPFVDDEAPLYVRRDPTGRVTKLGNTPLEARSVVSGGVYALSPAAREAAADARHLGIERMRGFLTWLCDTGRPMGAVEVACIVDVDHESDLRRANAWLASPGTLR